MGGPGLAIATRNMKRAIGKQRKFLSQQELEIFMSLTPGGAGNAPDVPGADAEDGRVTADKLALLGIDALY